jgi:hypothetical protein
MTDRVTLRFSSSPAWQSRVIRTCSGGSVFSHLDFSLEDGTQLGSSDSPEAPFLAGNPRGVAIRPPDYQQFIIRRDMVIVTPKADAILEKARSQLGKPFDGAALYAFLDEATFFREWRDNGQWFCAEHAVWSFEDAKYWEPVPLIWPKGRVTPTDVLLVFLFDPRFVNRSTFWAPVPGLKLCPGER